MPKQKSLTDLIKFLIGGGINTAFTFSLYYALQIMIPYQIAYALAFAIGILFSYWFNATIVFKKPMSRKGLFSFPLVYLVQYLVSALLLSFFVEWLHIPQSAAPLLVIVMTIPGTFMLTRWVLRRT